MRELVSRAQAPECELWTCPRFPALPDQQILPPALRQHSADPSRRGQFRCFAAFLKPSPGSEVVKADLRAEAPGSVFSSGGGGLGLPG